MDHEKIAASNQWWTINSEIYSASVPRERLLSCLTDGSEKSILLRPEQNSVELMKDLVCKFRKAQELVLNSCAGSLATSQACLQLSGHC